MRFLVVIRGVRTPPPMIEAPVTNMPLRLESEPLFENEGHETHHAAPRTLNPMQKPIPVDAHA
jgi:hypothetical protein